MISGKIGKIFGWLPLLTVALVYVNGYFIYLPVVLFAGGDLDGLIMFVYSVLSIEQVILLSSSNSTSLI